MGAEKLLGKGDMLYKQGVDTTRIHSAYVEEDEIELLAELSTKDELRALAKQHGWDDKRIKEYL
jgi:DNA segregation ATPase FtsK/SpoIIIE-like protein